MTAIVRARGFPNRLACERCACEIGQLKDGVLLPLSRASQDPRDFEPGEPSLHLADDCPCSCHEAFLIATRYDA